MICNFYNKVMCKIKFPEYCGFKGRIFFILKCISWIIRKIKNGIYDFAVYILIKILNLFQRKHNNIDCCFLQVNGLEDAIINRAYTDCIIRQLGLNRDRVLIIAIDQWKGIENILYPNIKIVFINIDKFNNNIIYRCIICSRLSSYKCNNTICNLKYKMIPLVKSILSSLESNDVYVSACEDTIGIEQSQFKEYVNNNNYTYINVNYIYNELERIPEFYNIALQKYKIHTDVVLPAINLNKVKPVDIAVRLRVKKKVQNLNAMWYKEFAKNFATQGDFGHESP